MKELFQLKISLLLLAAFVIAGCSSTDTDNDLTDKDKDEKNECIERGSNYFEEDPTYANLPEGQINFKLQEFSVNLFNKVCGEKHNNQIYSPVSLCMSLGVAANGAVGETRKEIINALGFDGLNIDQFNSYYKNLTKALNSSSSDTRLITANSNWFKTDISPKSEYIALMKDIFQAESYIIDAGRFQSDVNKWICDRTNGLIPQFEINQSADMVMLNATSFIGKWNSPFDKNKNIKDFFYNYDGTQTIIDYMNQIYTIRYLPSEKANFYRIDFKDKCNFLVILPHEDETLQNTLNKFDWDAFDGLYYSDKWRWADADIRMPKFKISTKVDFMEPLIDMGVNAAFDISKANFYNISDRTLHVTALEQSADIEVNETGIVATSANKLEMGPTANDFERIDLKINRPFAFMIIDNETSTILFIGKVEKFGQDQSTRPDYF